MSCSHNYVFTQGYLMNQCKEIIKALDKLIVTYEDMVLSNSTTIEAQMFYPKIIFDLRKIIVDPTHVIK